MNYSDFINQIAANDKPIIIYGSTILGQAMYLGLTRQGFQVRGYVHAGAAEFEPYVDGVEYIDIYNRIDEFRDYTIIPAATNELVRTRIASDLLSAGFNHVVSITAYMYMVIDDIYMHIAADYDDLEGLLAALKSEQRIDILGFLWIPQALDRIMRSRGIYTNRYIAPGDPYIEPLREAGKNPIFLSGQQSVDPNADAVIVCEEEVSAQCGHLIGLLQQGYRKIYFVNAKIIEQIRHELLKITFTGADPLEIDLHYRNMEANHAMLTFTKGDKKYMFRTPTYCFEVMAPDDKLEDLRMLMVDDFINLYGDIDFIPCENTDLSKVKCKDGKTRVYMAKFYKDLEIPGCKLPDWVVPIQGGAALTDVRVADVTDDTGENISYKNQDYSEGTSMYWMWKNVHDVDYIGLFHYRRHMAFDQKLFNNIKKYDVVLTPPTTLPIGIKKFFTYKFVLDYDWDLFMEGIKAYSVDYYRTALKYQNQCLYFSSNVMIMKKELFDEMCDFVFYVLENHLDAAYRNRGMIRKDRWLGFFVENLTSIFLMHNHERLNICCTDMTFYTKGGKDERR